MTQNDGAFVICSGARRGFISAKVFQKLICFLSFVGPPGLPGAAGPPAPPPMPGPCPVVCTHTCIRSCPPPCCRRWVPEDKLRLSDPVALVYNSLRMEFSFFTNKMICQNSLVCFMLELPFSLIKRFVKETCLVFVWAVFFTNKMICQNKGVPFSLVFVTTTHFIHPHLVIIIKNFTKEQLGKHMFDTLYILEFHWSSLIFIYWESNLNQFHYLYWVVENRLLHTQSRASMIINMKTVTGFSRGNSYLHVCTFSISSSFYGKR